MKSRITISREEHFTLNLYLKILMSDATYDEKTDTYSSKSFPISLYTNDFHNLKNILKKMEKAEYLTEKEGAN
jgi:hypothetical protein